MEKEYQGEVTFLPGYSVGHLSQDPLLDENRSVREIVEEGVKEIMEIIKEFEKINNSFGEPEVYENPDKMQQLMDRQAVLQEKSNTTMAGILNISLNGQWMPSDVLMALQE